MSLDNAVKLFSLKPNNLSYSIGIKWGETQYKLGLWIKSEMNAKNHFELLNVSFGLQNSATWNTISLRKQVAGFKIKTMHQMCLVTLSCWNVFSASMKFSPGTSVKTMQNCLVQNQKTFNGLLSPLLISYKFITKSLNVETQFPHL